MANNEPMIRPIPTEEGFRKMVDRLIGPDMPDGDIKTFIDLQLTTANAQDNDLWHLATSAARHAFTKTEAFEQAFRDFAGWPESVPYAADRYVVEAPREM